ncbi:MAG: protein BatD [Bacteroidales bacterium]|nr:protein BatD [Bacteroidales bacterium]
MKRFMGTTLALFLGAIGLFAQPTFRVEVPSVVAVDETFQVVFKANERVESFEPPRFEDFDVLTGPVPSQMSSTSIINGKRTQSYEMTYSYVLQAQKEGVFTLPTASVVIDGKTYTSKPVQVKVVQSQRKASAQGGTAQQAGASAQRSGDSISEDDLFLNISVNRRKVVLGEPVIVTIKLYTRRQISGFEDVRFPTFNGFWSNEFESPSNVSFVREEKDGVIYDAALLRQYMLIPQQTGTLTIDPAELVCLVPVRTQNRRGHSLFDDFFDSGYQNVRKRLSTKLFTLTVEALPAPEPASFGGGVGRFQLEANLSQTTVKAHEAVNLVITVKGAGNINLIDAPEYRLHPDFEVYDVKRSENISVGTAGPAGSRTFEVPFIPRSAGVYELEPVRMSYYDVQRKQYVTLESASLTLTVEAGETQAAVVSGGNGHQQIVKNLGEDIRYIVTRTDALRPARALFCGSLLYWGLPLVMVLLVLLVAWLLDKRIERKKDVVGTRNRQANKVARNRLKLANTFLSQQLYTAFYEELHKALIGYLSDKLTLPMSELNRDRITEVLTRRGADAVLVGRLMAVLDACEFARYAPQTDALQMQQHYAEGVEVLSMIESL